VVLFLKVVTEEPVEMAVLEVRVGQPMGESMGYLDPRAKRELLERMVLMGLLFKELRVKAQDMEVKPDPQMVGEEEVLLLVLAGKRSAATAVLEALAEIRQGVLVARAANQTRS
jgi:hypothetical protein